MAIERIEIRDFLVFRGEFAMDCAQGVNVIIGSNGTGKTTLLKVLYALCQEMETEDMNLFEYFETDRKNLPYDLELLVNIPEIERERKYICSSSLFTNSNLHLTYRHKPKVKYGNDMCDYTWIHYVSRGNCGMVSGANIDLPRSFIPSKEMLTHSKGLTELAEDFEIPFDRTLLEIIKKARRPKATPNKLSNKTKKIIKKVAKASFSKEVDYDLHGFFAIKDDGRKIYFSLEAEGYRKLGLLWKLLQNGLLEPGSVLFWDEPESSLNPELMNSIAEFLLDLSRNKVQIFCATHSDMFAEAIELKREENDKVQFATLRKEGEGIVAETEEHYSNLTHNPIVKAAIELYDAQVKKEFD